MHLIYSAYMLLQRESYHYWLPKRAYDQVQNEKKKSYQDISIYNKSKGTKIETPFPDQNRKQCLSREILPIRETLKELKKLFTTEIKATNNKIWLIRAENNRLLTEIATCMEENNVLKSWSLT